MAAFTFNVYTRRFGHADVYHLDRTPTGWHVSHLSYQGSCNKKGEPVLFAAMNQDSVNFPAALGDYFEFLWDQAQAGSITNVQGALDHLANWVKVCEEASPIGVFVSFK